MSMQRSQCSLGNPGKARANAGRNKDGGEVTDARREKRAIFGEPRAMEK
jgi:hypothetical protein